MTLFRPLIFFPLVPWLALAGRGNRSGRGEGGEKDQATGTSGRVLPEEFRAGLDAYFNKFEKERR